MLYDATQHGEEDQQLTTGREEAHRDADEEMARMKAQLEGLEQGLAQGLASLSREVQELRTELRVLKSAEPLQRMWPTAGLQKSHTRRMGT